MRVGAAKQGHTAGAAWPGMRNSQVCHPGSVLYPTASSAGCAPALMPGGRPIRSWAIHIWLLGSTQSTAGNGWSARGLALLVNPEHHANSEWRLNASSLPANRRKRSLMLSQQIPACPRAVKPAATAAAGSRRALTPGCSGVRPRHVTGMQGLERTGMSAGPGTDGQSVRASGSAFAILSIPSGISDLLMAEYPKRMWLWLFLSSENV